MGYIGNQTTNAFTSMDKQDITGNGGASYTLSHAVANGNEIEVFVNNVRQESGVAYTASGTALNMTGNVVSSDDFYVVFQGKAVGSIVPTDGSVGTAKITDGAVTSTKLATTIAPTNLETTASTFKMTDLSSNAFYRTDSWTPVWSSSGATDVTQSITTGTYGGQVGQYIRIGDLVNFTGFIQSPSSWGYTNGGANGQPLYIYGLPFKGASSNAGNEQWGISINYHSGLSWAQSLTITGMVRNNEKFIRLFYFGDSTSGNVDTSHV